MLFERRAWSLNLASPVGPVYLPADFGSDANPEILVIKPAYRGSTDLLVFHLYEADDFPGRRAWRHSEIRLPFTILPRTRPYAQITDFDLNGVPEVIGAVDTVFWGENTLFALEYVAPAEQKPGVRRIVFAGDDLASCVYLYRLEAGSLRQTRKPGVVTMK